MLFSRSFFVALLSAPFLVSADLAFTLNSTFAPAAGEPSLITWSGSSGSGTVTLVLRSGASNNLEEGTVVSTSIPNTGSYTWTPPADTVRGSDYTLQIINNQDTTDNNYSAYFVLESDNTVPTPASTVSNPASTASPSSTLSGATSSGSMMTSGVSTSTSSGSSSTSRSSTQTGSATQDLQASGPTSSMPGAGARATAAVGVLGAVALAAMAL